MPQAGQSPKDSSAKNELPCGKQGISESQSNGENPKSYGADR